MLFLIFTSTSEEIYGCGVNLNNVLTKDTSADMTTPGLMDTGPGVISVYASDTNSYILKDNGQILGVGKNFKGQLGDGTFTLKPKYTPANITNVKKFTAGVYSSFVVTESGEFYSYGSNDKGQLGDGTTQQRSLPTKIPSLMNIIEVASGGQHTLVLSENGTVFSFGSNTNGELGDGTTIDKYHPVKVLVNDSITHIAAGNTHSIIAANFLPPLVDQIFFTFGSNGFSELGLANGPPIPTPQNFLVNGETIKQVSAGTSFTMILYESGKVHIFGRNHVGQLGYGITPIVTAPTIHPTLSEVKQISCGDDHSLVLLKNGSVLAFGANNFGQLGDGTKNNRNVPISVLISSEAIQVAAGKLISIVLTKQGDCYSFGSNTFNELGRNYIDYRKLSDEPTNRIEQVWSLGFSFVLTTEGDVWNVGDNQYGQLGDGTTISTNKLRKQPKQTYNNEYPIQVALGLEFSLVLTKNGSVFSVGRNIDGQLGVNTNTDRTDTSKISDLSTTKVVQISAGTYHSIVVDEIGQVYTFGKGTSGQIGDGTFSGRNFPHKLVLPNGSQENITHVSAGSHYNLILSVNGNVYAFGLNTNYQLGLQQQPNVNDPTRLNITNIVQISAGNTHSLILDGNGDVFGFGSNTNSEIQAGLTSNINTPTSLKFINKFKIKQIHAGDRSSLFLDKFGSVYGIGYNEYGKLCDGGFEDIKLPTKIQSHQNYSRIERVFPTSLALLSAFIVSPLTCFGLNSTDPTVCSGRGNCTSFDTCACNKGFNGEKCEKVILVNPNPICFGISSKELSVCSSYGTCTNTDTCACFSGYSGTECEKTSCYDVLSDNPEVCSSHGICSAPDRCLCEKGYTGNNCQKNSTDDPIVIPDCVIFNNNYITYYKKENKYFIEANICSSKTGWGGISFHQQDGMPTASFIIVSWIQNSITYFRELKYHSNDGVNKFQEYTTLGIKLPKDQSFAETEFNDKQKFVIEVDEILLKKYDYISIACNFNPISSNHSFSYHQTLKTVFYNVTSSAKSVCDETVLTGFSKRISDVNSTVWVIEMSFYVAFLFIVFSFHNSQPLASRGIVPYLSIISQYGASFTSFQHFFFYLDWRSKYSCYLHSLLFENMLSLIFLLMPLNYFRFVLLSNFNKEKTHISESSTKSLYFKFIIMLKYLSNPFLILWISGGFLILSSMIDLTIIFAIPQYFQCTTLKSYLIYGIHLCFNLFFGFLLFVILLVDIVWSVIGMFRDYFVVKQFKKHAFIKSVFKSIQQFLYKNDPYFFRIEQIVAFLILLLYVALEVSAFNSIFGENRYNYYIGQYLNIYGRSIITYLFVVYQAFIPFILTLIFKLVLFIKKLLKCGKKEKLYLEYCLANEECFNLLFVFATEEWANENLLAWRSIEKYKKSKGQQKRDIAFDIYYMYLNGSSSPLEINIDSRNCKKVFEVINDSTIELDNEVFEEIEKNLRINLSDTYSRFIFSLAYQNFEKNSEFKENELNEIGFAKLE